MDEESSEKRQRFALLMQKSMGLAKEHDHPEFTPDIASNHLLTSFEQHETLQGFHTNKQNDTSVRRSSVIIRKSTWTHEDDSKLLELVENQDQSKPNWAAIAAHFPNRNRKRCRERYVNHLNPQLSRQAWTSEEEETLKDLHAKYGCSWSKISKVMSSRSPEEIKNQWRKLICSRGSKSTHSTNMPWLKHENDKLITLVQEHGAHNWFWIASQLPGRTDLQCRQRWFRVLEPSIIKGTGTWTSDEDVLLRDKVEEWGTKWTKIAHLLPGRTGKQCRERYLNHVDPTISRAPWTTNEDDALMQYHSEMPGQWTEIAQYLPGRPEGAVKNRWHALERQRLSAV